MREQDVAAVCALLAKSAEDQAVVSAIRIELDQGSVVKEPNAEVEGLWFIFLRSVLRVFAIFLAPVFALWAVLVGRFFGPRDECVARIHTEEPLPETHIHAPVLPSVLGRRLHTVCRNDVRKAARLLRRHKKIPAVSKQAYHSLDFLATVNATARAAGNFVPVGQTKVSVRRFIILIDRSRPDEPLALLFQRLAQALADEGVAVVMRYFDRDPRCALRSGGGPSDVLMLCSDGRGLLDPRTGVPFSWLERNVTPVWSQRVLLTPVPVASWGDAEDQLARGGGFTVLPAVSWALPAMARSLTAQRDGQPNEVLEVPFVPGLPMRWPPLLRGQALRWLSSAPPSPDDSAALLRQLRGLLGARAFGWLAACAAYPYISLPLAEYLAAQMDASDGFLFETDDARLREAQWMTLAYLPWLRQGIMPDWLGTL